MTILFDRDLSDTIKGIIMQDGVLTLISPYISDFKGWGNTKGTKITSERHYLTELLVSGTLEEDGRIIIITDKDSKNRIYSKGILKEIQKRDDTFWIYVYEIDKLHAKLFFNSQFGIVGSSNLTFPALEKNIELGLGTNLRNDLFKLRSFIGELIMKSNGLNEQAKLLKTNLKKHHLLKAGIIFDIVELIAHSHYLYRTTKIYCIWYSLKEPKILLELAPILDKFDNERKDIDKRLLKAYSPTNDKGVKPILKRYWKEELKIKEKQIKNIIKIWEKYLSGKISKSTNVRKFFIQYKNPIKLPESRVVGSVNMNEIVAKLIEERIKSPIPRIKK